MRNNLKIPLGESCQGSGDFVKKTIHLNSIGKVISTRTEIKDDDWDQENVLVELDSQGFSPEALAGLSDFSHVEIVFFMDQVDPAKVEKTAPTKSGPQLAEFSRSMA